MAWRNDRFVTDQMPYLLSSNQLCQGTERKSQHESQTRKSPSGIILSWFTRGLLSTEVLFPLCQLHYPCLKSILMNRARSFPWQILLNSAAPFAKFHGSPRQILGIPWLTAATHFTVQLCWLWPSYILIILNNKGSIARVYCCINIQYNWN